MVRSVCTECTVIGCLLLLLASPVAARAQAIFPEENGKVLAGVTSFDASVSLSTWLNVPDDRPRFRTNAQSAFELALRRDGVIVEVAAPNFICRIKAAHNTGLIVYAWDVEYYDYQRAGVHVLQWTAGGIVTVGRNNFTPQAAIQECSNAFANEWLKQNPRRVE
jgi:hypothetical protein